LGKRDLRLVEKHLKYSFSQREVSLISKNQQGLLNLQTERGLNWVLLPEASGNQKYFMPEAIRPSDFGTFRDRLGLMLRAQFFSWEEDLNLRFIGCNKEQVVGTLVGLTLLKYRFKSLLSSQKQKKPTLHISGIQARISKVELDQALHFATGTNFSRHLVNMPPSHLAPKSFVDLLVAEFKGVSAFQCKILARKALNSGGFGLISSLGAAAETGPYILHLSYRPRGVKSRGTLAFVGKGITYDTGGLDIKSAAGMRLMKKDMGGAAAIAGVALWTKLAKPKKNLDFYFAIAENAISKESYKPSDVLQSRSGLTVEIDNTDAEGRLALADAITLALENGQKTKIKSLIDVATLTGAIKVGLGSETGGLFSNNADLQNKLLKSAQLKGEPFWAMPLDQKQRAKLFSPVADMMNSAPGGYGGAVTAALFLESFVKGAPWAHFDIYAWNDRPQGALAEVGASGQAVQCLCDFVVRS